MQRLPTLLLTAWGLAACTERSVAPEVHSSTDPVAAAEAAPEASSPMESSRADADVDPTSPAPSEAAVATFGAGCFWCVEAVLEQLDGVLEVTSGYMGGTLDHPTYKQVCTGRTGHAEVVQVRYDPALLSYGALLEWFFRLHDPTTLNRQGADVGTQYRSAIFYHTAEQRRAAETAKATLERERVFDDPIVTEIAEASTFWPAEDYHQDYYRANKDQSYCQVVIAPKLGKLGLEQ